MSLKYTVKTKIDKLEDVFKKQQPTNNLNMNHLSFNAAVYIVQLVIIFIKKTVLQILISGDFQLKSG